MTIAKNSEHFASGYNVCANPIASIDNNIGFTPDWVEVYNPTNGCKVSWFKGLTEGTGIVEPPVKNGLLTTPGCVIGSTADQVASILFYFGIAGIGYSKAAVAAGTAPTATVIPQSKWGLFGFEIGANGTIDNNDAADNATGYNSEALAIAAKPAASADHVFFMYVTVIKSDGAFTGATTNFNAANVTANFYSESPIGYAQSLGIALLGSSTVRGFRIGAHTQLQVATQTLYWKCGAGR